MSRDKISVGLYWVSILTIVYTLLFTKTNFQIMATGLLWSYFVTVVGLILGAHRFFTHNAFKTSPAKKRFLGFLTILGGMGSPQDWILSHTSHHAKADTPQDPSSWRDYGLLSNYTSLWLLNTAACVIPAGIRLSLRSLQNDRFANFLHNHYGKIHIVLASTALFISVDVFVWIYLCPVFMGHFTTNLENHLGHRAEGQGNRHVCHSRLVDFFFLGDGAHDYHHDHPNAYKYSDTDIIGKIIERFFILK